MSKVELEYMPKINKYRVLVDGKAFPRRFPDFNSALKKFNELDAKHGAASLEVNNG